MIFSSMWFPRLEFEAACTIFRSSIHISASAVDRQPAALASCTYMHTFSPTLIRTVGFSRNNLKTIDKMKKKKKIGGLFQNFPNHYLITYLKILYSFLHSMFRHNSLKQLFMVFLGVKSHEHIILSTQSFLFFTHFSLHRVFFQQVPLFNKILSSFTFTKPLT